MKARKSLLRPCESEFAFFDAAEKALLPMCFRNMKSER